MSDTVIELAERGRALSPAERGRLVDLLLATTDATEEGELSEAWNREIDRRIAAYRSGTAEAYDLEDVLAEAQRLAP